MKITQKLFCPLIFFLLHLQAEPLIVATLMIKDEAASIRQTLEPLINGNITDFLIFDTGSTDATLDIVRNLFNENNHCHVHIFQEPFIDFATSRNRALELTENAFPNAIFILMLDAEWYLHDAYALLEYCKKHIHDPIPAHVIRIVHKTEHLKPILMRRVCKLRYKYPIHEELMVHEAGQVPSNVYFKVHRSNNGQEATQKRWLRDKEILLREYEKNGSNLHTLFYLGQTLCCLDDYVHALEFFDKCIPLALEEININFAYEAAYRAATIVEELINMKIPNYSWDQALEYYHTAINICPYRAEPLHQIADYYYKHNQMTLCFEYAFKACRIPFPSSITAPIESHIYNKIRYTTLHNVALILGKKKIVNWCRERLNIPQKES